MSECSMCGYREAEEDEEYCSFCAICNRGQQMTIYDEIEEEKCKADELLNLTNNKKEGE